MHSPSAAAGARRVIRAGLAALLLALAGAAPAAAQTLFQGRIDVSVQDAQERAVPGASVEIAGPSTELQISGRQRRGPLPQPRAGQLRRDGDDAGIHRLPQRHRARGRCVQRAAPRHAAGRRGGGDRAGQCRSPHRRSSASDRDDRRVAYEELQQVPSRRNPWVVLQTVPGVVVDRVNVGGAESGQQSKYLAKGAGLAENTWNLDGIPVTDLAATGSSPTYYDFDMFQEMSVTTGGASATNPTAGVQLNMQFKTGTNRPSGAAHRYGAGEGLQSNNLPDDSSTWRARAARATASRT